MLKSINLKFSIIKSKTYSCFAKHSLKIIKYVLFTTKIAQMKKGVPNNNLREVTRISQNLRLALVGGLTLP